VRYEKQAVLADHLGDLRHVRGDFLERLRSSPKRRQDFPVLGAVEPVGGMPIEERLERLGIAFAGQIQVGAYPRSLREKVSEILVQVIALNRDVAEHIDFG